MFFGVRELSAHCLQSGATVGLYLTRPSGYSFRGLGTASISFLCCSYPITSRRSRDDGKVQSSNRLKATYSHAQNTHHLIVIQGNCPHFNVKFACNIFFLSVQILLNRTATKPQNKIIQPAVLCILQAPGSSLIPDTYCLNRRCRGLPQCRHVSS
jgi:hypothetical protein